MKPKEQGTFDIIRYYNKENTPPRIIATHYTWKQAQVHVNDPKTRKAYQWFDGFIQTS